MMIRIHHFYVWTKYLRMKNRFFQLQISFLKVCFLLIISQKTIGSFVGYLYDRNMLVNILNRSTSKYGIKLLAATSQVRTWSRIIEWDIIWLNWLAKWNQQVMSPKCGISLQEYQSKKLLEEAGLNIQRFQMASSPEQAHEAGRVLRITN